MRSGNRAVDNMNTLKFSELLWLSSVVISFCLSVAVYGEPLGQFEGQGNLGNAQPAGSARFDLAHSVYHVTGGGSNLWFGSDAAYWLWRRVQGDLAFSADIVWEAPGGNAHRKAGLMLRESLAADSPYVDVVVHGDGLVSLQYRDTRGGPTREVQARARAARQLRLERWGNFFSVSLGDTNGAWVSSGCAVQLSLSKELLAGLVVCSHDDQRIEPAAFSRVQMVRDPFVGRTNAAPLRSVLEVVPIQSQDRRVIYHATNHFEAPNWLSNGSAHIFNSGGKLYRLSREALEPTVINTDFAVRCNNDHGISPDGTQLVISDQSQIRDSLIYILPIDGGTPRQVTPKGPSYWHGWSPDGKTLAYCASRNGEYDVYTISVDGGEERRLTDAPGLDDGPEYSPDAKTIYFNSDRTGLMQIWAMNTDGTQQRQVTSDNFNNWFAHPSPDGKYLVYLSYEPEVKGHPENMNVLLRLQPIAGGQPRVLARLFGGQGTINVPSWSPDSREVAFVSYHPDLGRTLSQSDVFEKDIRAHENSDATSGCPQNGILFLGSSTMAKWKSLQEDFAGLPVLGRGFGGSKIRDSVYYFDRMVAPYHPRMIVFYAGDNDLAIHRNPDRVLADFQVFTTLVHEQLPQTRIAFLSVKPSRARWEWVDKIRQANELVKQCCARDDRLIFVDTFTATLDASGQPRSDWFEADGLHLNRQGYAQWASIITPILKK
jgi:TolB protein